MVDEGILVQDFRFRGFPNRSMEKPTLPVTIPYGEEIVPVDNTMPVWVRSHRQYAGGDSRGDGLMYGERTVDNMPRPRGLRNPPLDAPTETGQGYQTSREEAEAETHRVRRELLRDLRRDKERNQLRSPQRRNMPERRGRYQNGYEPDTSMYQPSFGQATQKQNGPDVQGSRGGDSPTRREQWGIPVTDFIRHDEFEGGSNYGQGSGDSNPNPGGATSPRRDIRGIPITDFIKHEELQEAPSTQKQNSPDVQGSRGGDSPTRREQWGIPVTDFIRHDEFEGQGNQGYSYRGPQTNRTEAGSPRRDVRGAPVNGFSDSRGAERTPGRRYRLPEEPAYDPFGRAGGGAPNVDRSGRTKTNVFGNFEKTSDPRELEKDTMAKRTMRQDLSRGIEEQRTKRDQDNQYQRRSDVDLADLMRKKEVGRPRVDPRTGILTNQHLPISDVSKVKMNYQPRDGKETEEYRKFLQQQMEDRARSKQQEMRRQRDEADQHFAKFDSQWGHRGGGAPADSKEHRKLKLDDNLHRASRGGLSVNPAYQENYFEDDFLETPRFVKNTIHSTSSQFYQLPSERRWVRSPHHKTHYEDNARQKPPDDSPRYVKNTIDSTSTNNYQYPSPRMHPRYYQTNAPYATGYTYGI